MTHLVAEGETEVVEFKRSTGQRTEAAKTVCAMLNGLGGFVLFGVSGKGEIFGQQVTSHTLEDIAHELRRLEPPAFPDIETVTLKSDLTVIVLLVSGGGGPYTYDGRPYLRQGPTTIVMPHDVYERRILERLHATQRWENEPAAEGVSLDDLDQDEILLTVENAVRQGRLEPPRNRDPEAILRGLNLMAGGRLLNAAVALYGQSQRLHVLYPQCSIRLARFRGNSRLADFLDNRQYWGHAFALLRRAESFLLDHVPIAGRVVPGKMAREDRPWYPPRATREALANAICHRDYTIPGGAIAVAMYDDFLEIANPGALHFGLTPEKLFEPHESRPWNPIIAGVFYRAGIIERWGIGTLNILEWCRENGSPDPRYAEETGSVVITFFPVKGFETESHGMAYQAAEQPESQPELQPESLPDRILLLLVEEPLSKSQISARLGQKKISGWLNRVIRELISQGYIEHTIPDKPQSRLQRYRLTVKGQERRKPFQG